MTSKWFNLKEKAVKLRNEGYSIRIIEKKLGIPRSTLSGWLKNVVLSVEQKKKLHQKWTRALFRARAKASLWHRDAKEKRLRKATNEALEIVNNIDFKNRYLLELTLSILYLGEGTKATEELAIGSSEPLILKFFLAILRNVYNLDSTKIRCQLNLRADQNPEEMKLFWSQELKLPLDNFKYVALDQRTKGSKTYSHYKGVCQVRYGSAAIQRRLLHVSKLFCNKVIENYLGS